MNFPNPHAAIDEENRERDKRVAALIRRDPRLIALAAKNLTEWTSHWQKSVPAWEEWREILRMLTPAQLADFLESRTPKAERLRQSSPFLGLLAEMEQLAGKR